MAWILIYTVHGGTPHISGNKYWAETRESKGTMNEGGVLYGSKDFKTERYYINNFKSPLKFNAMKKLISLFKVSKEQPRGLSSFLKIEFKEELVNIDMPHVGGYKPGSRTKIAR